MNLGFIAGNLADKIQVDFEKFKLTMDCNIGLFAHHYSIINVF